MPGSITEETFISVTLLIVLGSGHEHMLAMIQRDMQAATKDNHFLSDQILLYFEQDLQLIPGDKQCSGMADAIALAAQSSQAHVLIILPIFVFVQEGEWLGSRSKKLRTLGGGRERTSRKNQRIPNRR